MKKKKKKKKKTPENTIQKIKRDVYTAVKNYSSYITKLDTTSKGCNRTLNLNLNHPNFNNNSRIYLIDILDKCQEISTDQRINYTIVTQLWTKNYN